MLTSLGDEVDRRGRRAASTPGSSATFVLDEPRTPPWRPRSRPRHDASRAADGHAHGRRPGRPGEGAPSTERRLCSPMSERVRIIVPHRGLAAAKTRLAPVLDPGERATWRRSCCERVLRVARQAVADVVVISPSEALARAGRADRRACSSSSGGWGSTTGLDQAREAALAEGIELLGRAPRRPARTCSRPMCPRSSPRRRRPAALPSRPTAAGPGRTASSCAPPTSSRSRSARRACAAHRAAAEAAGVPIAVVERPGLAFDLDTPSDLARWLELGDAA